MNQDEPTYEQDDNSEPPFDEAEEYYANHWEQIERDEQDEWDFSFENQFEHDSDNCGYEDNLPQICYHVGTELCSFYCPFHYIHFHVK